MGTAEDHGTDTNKRMVFNRAPMHDGAMTNRDVVAKDRRAAIVHMNNGPILYTGVLADHDWCEVAAQHRTKPNTGMSAHPYIAH